MEDAELSPITQEEQQQLLEFFSKMFPNRPFLLAWRETKATGAFSNIALPEDRLAFLQPVLQDTLRELLEHPKIPN